MNTLYQLYFYAPSDYLEQVKEAIFKTGAGQVGNYSHCCWQTKGAGQFKPNEDAKPFAGQADCLTQEEEYRVELICSGENLPLAIEALKKAHPYEEPAYGAIQIVT